MEILEFLKPLSKSIAAVNLFNGGVQAGVIVNVN